MFKLYPEKLIIFGNGFDLWMGLPTTYEDYKNFIFEHKKEYQNCWNLFKFIETKLNVANSTLKLWSNLEQRLYKFLTDNVEKTNEIINEIKNKNIDLIKACIEKNESIRKWIEQIRLDYKEKLDKLNEWYKKIIKQNYSFLWNFNYVQNWKGNEFTRKLLNDPLLQNNQNITVVAEAHGHYEVHQNNLEYGYQLGFQLGASWQQISENNKKYCYYLNSSLIKLVKLLKIKNNNGIDERVNSNQLFFLLLFCCKHKDLIEQLQEKYKTSVSEDCIHKDFIKYLYDIGKGKNKIVEALYLNFDARKRPNENFYINSAYFPIDIWKQNNIFPDVYILGLNIDGQDKLYFVNQERSPIKLAIEHGKECYLSYYSQGVNDDKDKKDKLKQYKNCSEINDVDIINSHVLEFNILAKKAFGEDLFNELIDIKEISC